MLADRRGNGIRIGGTFATPNHDALLINHTDRSQLLRNIQTNVMRRFMGSSCLWRRAARRLTPAAITPCPSLTSAKASRAVAVKHGRRPSAEPTRSVLDGGEHGVSLEQGGSLGSATVLKRQPSLPVSTKPAGASGFGLSVGQSRPKPRGGTIA